MAVILLTSPTTARRLYYGEEALAGLRALAELRLNERDRPLAEAELVAMAGGVDIVVSDRQTPAPATLFDALPELRAFVRCAVDIRNVDVEAASRNGTLVTRASPGFVDSVAELVIGLMIDLARHVSQSVIDYRQGRMPPVRMGRQLSASTIGIIGYGAIGRRLAARTSALGMRVLVHDPHVTKIDAPCEPVDLPGLLAAADFVVCLAVATEQTENLMNAEAFARMRPGSFFVNVSRGNLVDEAALLAGLDEGGIAGCALDVGRAPDQMPSPKLAAHPKVVATPHIGGLTPEAIAHQALETVRQCRVILEGRLPDGAVNGEAARRIR